MSDADKDEIPVRAPGRRVRMLTGVSGLDFSWAPGEVVEMTEEAAARWADGRRAEYADDGQAPEPERGEQVETAAERSRGRGGATAPAPETTERTTAKRPAARRAPTPRGGK